MTGKLSAAKEKRFMLVRTNRSHRSRFGHLVAWSLLIGSAVFAQQTSPGRNTSSAPKSVPAQQNAAQPRTASDVQGAADQLLRSLSIKCATETYIIRLATDSSSLRAVKQLSIRPLPWAITEADRLNKIDWIGELILTTSASRSVRESEEQAPDPAGWQPTLSATSHLMAEDIRTRRTDIEGACSKCVSVANAFISIGAYRTTDGAWHFFHPTTGGTLEGVDSRYSIFPARGETFDIEAISARKKSCSAIAETSEFREARRKAEEAAAAAEEEARRKAGLPSKSLPVVDWATGFSVRVWRATKDFPSASVDLPTKELKMPPGVHLSELSQPRSSSVSAGSIVIPLTGGDGNKSFAGADIPRLGPSYLCVIAGGGYRFVPVPALLESARTFESLDEARAPERAAGEARSALARRSAEPQNDLETKTQADGFWLDPGTGLTWLAKAGFMGPRGCKNLTVAGAQDWRVANIDELQSLSDPSHDHEFLSGATAGKYHIAGGIMLGRRRWITAQRSGSSTLAQVNVHSVQSPPLVYYYAYVVGEGISNLSWHRPLVEHVGTKVTSRTAGSARAVAGSFVSQCPIFNHTTCCSEGGTTRIHSKGIKPVGDAVVS